MTTKTRDLSDLLDANGDVKATHLDNASGTTINNNANNRIITGSSSANTLEGETNLTFDGTNLDLPDDKKIRLGTGNDLEIYHNGSHSIIEDVGTGKLEIRSNGTGVDIQKENAEFMARFITDGAVELYHDHSKKFETTSSGATVTGRLTADATDEKPIVAHHTDGSAVTMGFQNNTSNSNAIGFDGTEFIVKPNGTETFRINGSGNVGIGTTSPNGILELKSTGNTNFFIIAGNTSASQVVLGDTDDIDVGKIAYSHNGNQMEFTVNASERMRINSSGAVSIGSTANSGYKLKVNAQGDSLGAGYMLSDVYNQPSFEITNTNNSNFGQSVLWLQCNRTTTNGSYNFLRVIQSGIIDKLFIRDSGNVVNANNSYGAISDLKLKEQITDASSQWSDIKNIQIKKFKFKHEVAEGDSDSLWKLGVIAQEIETVSPSLVETVKDTDKEGNAVLDDEGNETFTKNVKYSVLYMKAVKALQEAMQKIEDLEARVDTLEGN